MKKKITSIVEKRKKKLEMPEQIAERALKEYDRDMDDEPQSLGDPKNLSDDEEDGHEKD